MKEKNEIEIAVELLKGNKELNKVVSELVDLIILNKKLSFPVEEFQNTRFLVENEIIKINARKIAIENYTPIAIKFYDYYKKDLKFRSNKDFSKQLAFISQIREAFMSGKNSRDYNNLENAFLKIIITEANQKYNNDFTDYISEITLKGIQESNFIRTYSSLVPTMNLKDKSVISNAVHLMEITNKPEVAWNVDQQRVLEGIRQRSLLNFTDSITLFKLLLKQNDIKYNPLLAAVVAGLYEKIGQTFYQDHLALLIDSNKHIDAILNGLSSIRNLTQSDAKIFLKLFDDHSASKDIQIELANIMFCLLKTNNPLAKETINQAFRRLGKMARTNNTGLISLMLREITYTDLYEKERINLLHTIINQDFFVINEEVLQAVSDALLNVKEIKLVKKILLALAAKAEFRDIANHFSSAFYDVPQADLDGMLIAFLLDDKANVRYLANDMLNHSGKNYNLNLLELAPLEQYKIWVAMCQNILEPKNFLPPLFPLLHSPSATVRESFICRLELYTEDYGSHIIKLLEKNLDLSSTENQNIVLRIKKYSDDYFELNVKIKHNIPEINPYYTHYKIFRKFESIYRREFNASMQKSSDKNSFLSLVTNIQLAKGGGWKIGNKNEISKLSSFPFSMNLPRTYFAFPDEYEMTHGIEQKTDWNKDTFSQVIKWIANEQQ